MGVLITLLKLFRLRETINKIKGVVVALLVYGLYTPVQLAYYFHTAVFAFLTLSYIYVINDFFDSEADKKAGKRKPIHHMKKSHSILLILALLSSSTAYFLLFFNPTEASAAAYALLIALGSLYSLRPVYLKGRGFAGILAGALCQRPLLVVAVLLGVQAAYSASFVAYFFVVFFLLEAVVLVGHQVEDREGDVAAGLGTWVARSGERTVRLLLNVFVFAFGLFSLFLLYALSGDYRSLIYSAVFSVLNVDALHLRHLETYYRP